MIENINEVPQSPEKPAEQIISGYNSIFDKLPSDPKEIEEFKNRYKPIFGKIVDAMTLAELYAATKEIIDLPETTNEQEMNSNLTDLCCHDRVTLMYKDPPDPIAFWAYTVLDHIILMRLVNITSKK